MILSSRKAYLGDIKSEVRNNNRVRKFSLNVKRGRQNYCRQSLRLALRAYATPQRWSVIF